MPPPLLFHFLFHLIPFVLFFSCLAVARHIFITIHRRFHHRRHRRRQNPEHLLIFAAGNLGDDVTGCSISSPAIGKNCLAVGSSMSGAIRLSPPSGDMDDVSDFSSVGPTTDGRIKPDVVAPGHYVSCCVELYIGSAHVDREMGIYLRIEMGTEGGEKVSLCHSHVYCR